VGTDEKKALDDEFDRLFPKDFLESLGHQECEPDIEAIAKLDALDAFDRFERVWLDRPRATLSSGLPAPTGSAHVATMPLRAKADPPEVDSSTTVTTIAVRHLFRSTKRKACKFRPNCFGSQSLHDPESADCRSCKFSEGCKKTIAEEITLLEASMTAVRTHLKPSTDQAALNARLKFIRARHLRLFRKSLRKRRQKAVAYQHDRRAKRRAAALIEKELQDRLSTLRSAILHRQKDKFLQQLRGQEEKIVAVWEIEQRSRLADGSTCSAAQLANAFNQMIGVKDLSRHQARTYRSHFRKLEQSPHVWKRFVKSPDRKIA